MTSSMLISCSCAVLVALLLHSTQAYQLFSSSRLNRLTSKAGLIPRNNQGQRFVATSSSTRLLDIPLELEGQLDPSKAWEVKFVFNGEEKTVKIPEDKCVLVAGEEIFDGVDSSCRNGVCTTCAGQVIEGRENVKLAVHGLGKPQLDAGFVCTCQSYVVGPGVVVKLGTYDEVYESQYGQYEKSYEMKFGEKKEEKKKNFLGF